MIPAQCRDHTVRLSVIPTKPGDFEILGVELRMLRGCVSQKITPISREACGIFDKGKLIYQEETQRNGKKSPLEFLNPEPEKPKKFITSWTHSFAVLNKQPLLEICNISLGKNQALELYEGEK